MVWDRGGVLLVMPRQAFMGWTPPDGIYEPKWESGPIT